jgi:hypothetical protein
MMWAIRPTLLVLVLLTALSGCVSPAEPSVPEPPEPEPPGEAVTYTEELAALMAGNVTETMLALPQAEITLADEPATVVLYLDAELDNEGLIARDDGCLSSLIVHRGEGGFALVDRQYIQGELSCLVVESYDGESPEVLVIYKSSAGVRIYAYTYNPDSDTFDSRLVYETMGNVSVYG